MVIGISPCYATQLAEGHYISVKRNLTLNHVQAHLRGELTLGVYLLGTHGEAKFTVIDADDDNGFGKLVRAQEALRFPSYLERSRRGGHLWFFFEEPIACFVYSSERIGQFTLQISKFLVFVMYM